MFIINDTKIEKDSKESIEMNTYLKRIYSLLTEEIRKKLLSLNISEKKKKSILKELAFLSEAKQVKYLDELFRIYKKIT